MKQKHLYIRTPLLEKVASPLPGKRVFFKMEAYQPSGSFKLRGMEHACRAALDKGAKGFLSSSGGNAGLAVAYVGRAWKVPVTVALPVSSPDSVARQLKNLGARVLMEGAAWDDTDVFCRELCRKDPSLAYLPPFEHPMIWEGHSTIVDELAAECEEEPDAIVLSVGGGGLLNGVALGLKRHGWEKTKVIAVETVGVDSLYQAYQAGKLVTLPEISSIAKSLGAKCVSPTALSHAQEGLAIPCRVTDEQAVRACLFFADEQRVLVEPACGASLSLVYEQMDCLAPFRNIVVIVCGGAKVDVGMMKRWSEHI